MPGYEVKIAERTKTVSDDKSESPIVRNVIWTGNAQDEEAAVEHAWAEWDRKYRSNERPAQILGPTVSLIEGVRVWFVGGPLDSTYWDTDIVRNLPLDYAYAPAASGRADFQRSHAYRLQVMEGNQAQYDYQGPTGETNTPSQA